MKEGKVVSKSKENEEEKTKMTEKKPDLVPPDGGWGWAVVFAFALSNVIAVPILQSFGLLFRGKFEDLNMSGTDASVIINVNSSFGMICGLFTGFLLRSFGYRKIALIGSLINSIGVILTSRADSFPYFLITYGIISSIGFNLMAAALGLAINTYFRDRRGKAVGFGTTAMGLGPVFMPLIISKLMDLYGVEGTALILGGLSLHSVVAALLLQPVKWHMKPKKVSSESLEDGEEDIKEEERRKSWHTDNESSTKRQRTITESSLDHDSQSVYGFETPLPEHRKLGRRRFSRSISQADDGTLKPPNWWASTGSVNLGSSVKIFDERSYQPLREINEDNEQKHTKEKKKKDEEDDNMTTTIVVPNGTSYKNKNGDMQDDKDSTVVKSDEDKPEKKKLTFMQRLGKGIVNFFDLTLLKDPYYVNLMLGMSLAICGELNFSLLTPFILNDRGFNTDRTAIIMSLIAGLDIVFRFIVPFFSDHYKIHPRNMYIIALLMLISSRTAMIFSYSFPSMLTVAVALGIAKGVRTVYMTIVIPAYVPIERLAAASGIQMVTNGILLMGFGPLIGVIRDLSGSYNYCIVFINLLTVSTLIMWFTEIFVTYYRQKRRKTAG